MGLGFWVSVSGFEFRVSGFGFRVAATEQVYSKRGGANTPPPVLRMSASDPTNVPLTRATATTCHEGVWLCSGSARHARGLVRCCGFRVAGVGCRV